MTVTDEQRAKATALVDELQGFAWACGASEAGDGAFRLHTLSGCESEQTEMNLRAVLREAATLLEQALADVERLTKELADADSDVEHYARLAFIDKAAHPPVLWQTRAEAAEADSKRLREAIRREAFEEAAKIADAYAARMHATIQRQKGKDRPTFVAECKADAGESLATAIREAGR